MAKAAANRNRCQDRCGRGRHAWVQLPARQRARSLARVLRVFLHVDQIVQNIDAARQQAEGQKDASGFQEEIGHEELAVEDQRRVDDDAFHPLAQAHGLDEPNDIIARHSDGGSCRSRRHNQFLGIAYAPQGASRNGTGYEAIGEIVDAQGLDKMSAAVEERSAWICSWCSAGWRRAGNRPSGSSWPARSL